MIQLGGKFLRRRFFVGALVGGVLLPGGFILRAVEVVDSEATNDDEVMLMQAAVSPEEKEADGEMMMLPVAADDETNGVAVLQSAVRESNGKLTAQLRAAYVNWARDTVLTNLAVAGQGVPKDCLAEVMADATLRDAMFAAVYPPDPSILQNYARLRSELGANFLKKYQSLVIGVAVAMRVNGLLDVPRPVPPKQAARAANAERREAAEAPLVTAIAAFMKSNSVPALDLDQDAARREALAHALAGQGFTDPQLAAVTDAGRLFGLLQQAMIKLGQRPAEREAPPTTANWLRHLAAIYEATPSSTPRYKKGGGMTWPLFPLDRAPWPLLMPLTRSLPLGEANYIWEKFQGLHGDDRYHTYGPYKGPEGAQPLYLLPSPWHWNAWPDRIVHGGKCVTMSGIAVDTHSALGQPSVPAGQPGHANLISFYAVGDQWNAVVEQAYAGGPDVTHAAWPFRDLESTPVRLSPKGAGAEYHLGLAQAMNVGLVQYLNTRIAVNLYHVLPTADRKTLGTRLLTDATQINSFNPEPWYLLAHQTPDAARGFTFAKYVMEQGGDVQSHRDSDAGPRTGSLENFVEEDHPKPVEQQIHNYWRTLDAYITRFAILDHPVPAETDTGQQIFTFLKAQSPLISAADQMPYRLRFEGNDMVKAALVAHVRQHLQAGPKKADKGKRAFAGELKTFLNKLSPAEREQFLGTLRALIPATATDDPYLQVINAAEPKPGRKRK